MLEIKKKNISQGDRKQQQQAEDKRDYEVQITFLYMEKKISNKNLLIKDDERVAWLINQLKHCV